VALLGAVVAIAILGALCHTLAGLAVQRFQQTEHRAGQAQACWLAESALLRGIARLRQDADWSGETWTPVFSNTGGPDQRKAQVVITREAGPGESQAVLHVVATLTIRDGDQRRLERTAIVPLSSPPQADEELTR
jgi:hypothetical protein